MVGVKLHTAGWTVEQGAKLFVEQGFQEPANAYEEARRGAYNPTYLYYTLGKIQIQELRDEYRADIDISKLAAEQVVDAIVPGDRLRAEIVKRFAAAAQRDRPLTPKRRSVTPV